MARRLLDQNRQREARRQGIILDRLGNQFRPVLEREISSAMLEMVDHWEQTQIVSLPPGFRARLEAVYAQMAVAAITAFGSRILNQGKSAGLILERKEDFAGTMRNVALGYIQQEAIRRRITDVSETTRRQIINGIDAGYQEGIGTGEIAKKLRDIVPNLSALRAGRIARTETHGAANFGTDQAARLTGLPLRREWLAAHDHRTRTLEPLIGDPDEFGHRQADGQKVGPDQPFLIPKRGGAVEALMYPGDPNGSKANIINCRCTLGFIVDDGLDDEEEPPPPALVPQASAPQFAYENFVPAPTVEAAVKAMESSIAKRVSLMKGAKLEGINATHAATLEVIERFGLKPMKYFGDPKKSTRNYKWTTQHVAGFSMDNNEYLVKLFGLSEKAVAERFAKSEPYKVGAYNKARASIAQSKLVADEVKLRFAQLNTTDISWSPIVSVRDVATHEMGHKLHSEYLRQVNAILPSNDKGWHYLISEYAGVNGEELFAESFLLYMQGDETQYYRIYPPLLAFFRKLDKKGKLSP